MTDEEEKNQTTWKGISCGFPEHTEKKRCYSTVYLDSLPYEPTDKNEQVQLPIARRWQEMKMSEGAVWEIRAFLHSPSLPFCLYLPPSPPSLPVFLPAYGDVTKLLRRYTPPSFTHQP